MCLTPSVIKNPNFGSGTAGTFYKDCTSQYLTVPCGVCRECIANKQMQLVQRVQMESKLCHLFFCTLTYNDDMIPRLTTSTGVEIKYADFHDLQNFFKLARKKDYFGRPFKYAAVSERGSRRGRPHFHLIFALPKYSSDDYMDIMNLEHRLFEVIKDNWVRNVAVNKNGKPNNRSPKYVPLFTYAHKFKAGKLFSNYDLHYITPSMQSDGVADVGFYVMKYMLKPSPREVRLQRALKLNLPFDEYESIWKKVKSRKVMSKDFGSKSDPRVIEYIKSGLDLPPSEPYPIFVNPSNGQHFPLARFYRDSGHIVSPYHYDVIKSVFPSLTDNVVVRDVPSMNNVFHKLASLDRINSQVFSDGDTLDIFE